jgi:two-component system chemotaxis response regulator CheY
MKGAVMPRQIRILLVDDSVATRKMLMRSLTDTGLADFRFMEANDGVDALEKYRPGQLDLLMVDMEMPRMDGIEFLRTLRRKYPHCPPAVIVTSEMGRERMMAVVNEAGADALLLKPLNVDRLKRGLKRLIESIPDPTGPWTVPHGDVVGDALKRVMRSVCDVELETTDEPFGATMGNVVFSMISIYGEVQWTISVGYEEDAAVGVASRLAGEQIPFDSEDLGDAIGEITNMVAGEIKRALLNRNMQVQISLPTVLAATEIRWLVHSAQNVSHDLVRYSSPVGKMRIALTVGQGVEVVL